VFFYSIKVQTDDRKADEEHAADREGPLAGIHENKNDLLDFS
jgi:hypothetical protein